MQNVVFIFKVITIFLIHYSIKLVNNRNRVVFCVLMQLIKQFSKFAQNCDLKNMHNLTLDVVSN